MKLNFTFKEMLHSDTAKIYGINNIPSNADIYDNILTAILNCYQPVRNYINKPMNITSGYRSLPLNVKLGGAPNSHHTKGQAIDFTVTGLTTKQIVDKVIGSGVPYTQLIEEYGKDGSSWCHLSYDPKDLRKEVLIYKNGVYTKR